MLKYNKKLFIVTIYHALMLYASMALVFYIYKLLHGFPMQSARMETGLMVFFAAGYLALMWKDLYSKPYSLYFHYTVRVVARNLSIATLLTVLVTIAVLVLWPTTHVSRVALLIFLLAGTSSFVALHLLYYAWILRLSRRGLFKKRVLYIGTPDTRFPLQAMFQDAGITKELCGQCYHVGTGWHFVGANGSGEHYAGLEDLFFRNQISEAIVFLGSGVQNDLLAGITDFCRENAISYFLVPDIGALPRVSRWQGSFPYIPVIERYASSRDSLLQISLKRLFDIFFSFITLVLFSPFWAIIALAIWLEDRGPSLYVSTRIGKNGMPIRFYKFRSMVLDAEKLKEQLLAQNERKDGPLFKMKDDPRITRVGKFLRTYSLDEMPQFLNVLKGDMSIVGPRPHLPSEVACYASADYLRLECIPGITCLPQIHGRNDLSFRQWVDLDIQYRKEWTLLGDFKLIFQTALVVLRPLFRQGQEGF